MTGAQLRELIESTVCHNANPGYAGHRPVIDFAEYDRLAVAASLHPATIADLADALAVVFAYNASNATVAPDGSLSFETGPTSYWRDRAEAVAALLPTQASDSPEKTT